MAKYPQVYNLDYPLKSSGRTIQRLGGEGELGQSPIRGRRVASGNGNGLGGHGHRLAMASLRGQDRESEGRAPWREKREAKAQADAEPTFLQASSGTGAFGRRNRKGDRWKFASAIAGTGRGRKASAGTAPAKRRVSRSDAAALEGRRQRRPSLRLERHRRDQPQNRWIPTAAWFALAHFKRF